MHTTGLGLGLGLGLRLGLGLGANFISVYSHGSTKNRS